MSYHSIEKRDIVRPCLRGAIAWGDLKSVANKYVNGNTATVPIASGYDIAMS